MHSGGARAPSKPLILHPWNETWITKSSQQRLELQCDTHMVVAVSADRSKDSIGTTQHKVVDIYSAHAQFLVFAQQQLHGTVK